MSKLARLLLRALVLLVGLPIVLGLVLGVTNYLTSDCGGLMPALRRLVEASTGRVKLDEDMKDHQVVLRGRTEVRNDVVEGRCSLLKAAARFRDLNTNTPHFDWERFRSYYPAASDQEAHCQHVIGAVSAYLADRPDRRRAVIHRLETELQERLQRGPIELPSTDESSRHAETDPDP
jgi:hypothetical protein